MVPEVADSTLSLIDEIEAGNIPDPGLIDWSVWLLWRAGAGREPPRPRGEKNGYRLQGIKALEEDHGSPLR